MSIETPIVVGRRYKRWKVIAKTATGWLCRCECGTERDLKTGQVRRTKSCGCANPRNPGKSITAQIEPGNKYNRWTVLSAASYTGGHQLWLCRCVCGTEREVSALALAKGSSQSCGCRRWEMGRKRGISPPSKRLPGGSYDKHTVMQICNNCNADFDPAKEGLVTTEKARAVAAVCGSCLEGGRVVKLVLRRGDVGSFGYEQFATLEALSGGLTSPRRAG